MESDDRQVANAVVLAEDTEPVRVPPFVFGPDRELELTELEGRTAHAVAALATGMSRADVAELTGLDEKTVEAIRHDNDGVSVLLDRIRQDAAEVLRARGHDIAKALADDASDAGSRTQPSSAKVLYEAAGVTNRAPQVHIGDNVTTVFDRSQHVHLGEAETDEDRHRRAERRRRLGLD